jgi:hypothetical protein
MDKHKGMSIFNLGNLQKFADVGVVGIVVGGMLGLLNNTMEDVNSMKALHSKFLSQFHHLRSNHDFRDVMLDLEELLSLIGETRQKHVDVKYHNHCFFQLCMQTNELLKLGDSATKFAAPLSVNYRAMYMVKTAKELIKKITIKSTKSVSPLRKELLMVGMKLTNKLDEALNNISRDHSMRLLQDVESMLS